jgi:hypothetical protein
LLRSSSFENGTSRILEKVLPPEIIFWFEKDFEQAACFLSGLSLELQDVFKKIFSYVNQSICH